MEKFSHITIMDELDDSVNNEMFLSCLHCGSVTRIEHTDDKCVVCGKDQYDSQIIF